MRPVGLLNAVAVGLAEGPLGLLKGPQAHLNQFLPSLESSQFLRQSRLHFQEGEMCRFR